VCVQGEWAGETVGPDVWETCRELIPAGSVFAFLAEHRERLQPPEMFAEMYLARNGRPSPPPQVLAATVVLQSLFGTSDVETVLELRCDPRWRAACGLGRYDVAFDPSLLTCFRRRLQQSSDPGRISTRVKEVVAATGILRGKRRRALDLRTPAAVGGHLRTRHRLADRQRQPPPDQPRPHPHRRHLAPRPATS
jgi:hypothetical protein